MQKGVTSANDENDKKRPSKGSPKKVKKKPLHETRNETRIPRAKKK